MLVVENSFPFSVKIRFPMCEPCRVLCSVWGTRQCWGSCKGPPAGFCPGGTVGYRRPLHVVLCRSGGEAVPSACSRSSYLLMRSVLVSGAGVCSASPLCSRILSMVSFHESLLVVLLERGSQLRNDLCYHLGDVPPETILKNFREGNWSTCK